MQAQNILVDSKFRAKVADFGLSQKENLALGLGAAINMLQGIDNTLRTSVGLAQQNKPEQKKTKGKQPAGTGTPFWMAPELRKFHFSRL